MPFTELAFSTPGTFWSSVRPRGPAATPSAWPAPGCAVPPQLSRASCSDPSCAGGATDRPRRRGHPARPRAGGSPLQRSAGCSACRRGDVLRGADRRPGLAPELEEVYAATSSASTCRSACSAETPPAGFGFSDTAFRVFVLMASRRLKSDRFFTDRLHAGVLHPDRARLDRRQRHADRPRAPLSGPGPGPRGRGERLRALAPAQLPPVSP